ncbi:MAG: 30S ribosomal protein S20 [Alphaproteobacteria bacterium]|jgi:small subunit ribosomal protein S20|nr:30S ribosomal protein S20 [Alphaproteobacteria bacterium]
MANTSSAEKAIRKIARRTAVNKARRTMVRGTWRSVEEALAKGDATAALTALKSAETQTMRAVTKGVLKKNTASRKVSRLTQRVKKLQKA